MVGEPNWMILVHRLGALLGGTLGHGGEEREGGGEEFRRVLAKK